LEEDVPAVVEEFYPNEAAATFEVSSGAASTGMLRDRLDSRVARPAG
jgi:hypothetical protein